MKKYELHNNGEKIGVLKTFGKALRRLDPKYKIASTLLVAGGIAISIISCGKKTTPEGETVEPTVGEALEGSLIESTDLFRADLYMYYPTDEASGTICFCTSEYLEEHNLVPVDNIDTRYDFIMDFELRIKPEYVAKNPEADMSVYEEKYQFFRQVYEEYIDGNQKDSFAQKEYLLGVEEDLIKVIHGLDTFSYIPEVVDFDKYLEMTYPQEDKKYTIEYYVPEDATLSEIVHSYADNPTEYEETIQEIMDNPNNDVENPDLIYAGTTLELPNVDLNDAQDTFGYTFTGTTDYPDNFMPEDELKQRFAWINNEMNDIYVLSGDTQSQENKKNLLNAISAWKIAYSGYLEHEVDIDTVLYDSREICDSIYLLTGHKYEIVFPDVGRNR